jgi:ureidoglycolate lyase
MAEIVIKTMALTAQGFAPFGDVMETRDRRSRWINEGTCQRFDDLAQVDVLEAGGRPMISIFKATPRTLPLQVRALERHPLSSQSFFPLDGRRFLVVVAEEGVPPVASRIRAYLGSGSQGVTYRRNTWHHSLIALDATTHFLVVDRAGPGQNCEEIQFDDSLVVQVAAP